MQMFASIKIEAEKFIGPESLYEDFRRVLIYKIAKTLLGITF